MARGQYPQRLRTPQPRLPDLRRRRVASAAPPPITINTSGAVYVGVDVTASAATDHSLATYVGVGVEPHALVSKNSTATGLLTVGSGATATLTTTKDVTGRVYTGVHARSSVTSDRNSTGHLPVAVAPRAAASIDFPYPVSVSGRKVLDQNGNVYLIKGMSHWALSQEGTNAEITDSLEGLAALGFNAVIVAPCGVEVPEPPTGDHHPYENDAGDDFFTGTPFQSTLGPAWATMDWIMEEATRLEMTVFFTLFVSWGTTGSGPELVAATNAQVEDYGEAVATRYAAYPNIVWHMEGDFSFDWGVPIAERIDAYYHGLQNIEGGHVRLIAAEPDFSRTSYDQFISQEGNGTTGYGWFHVDLNTPIRDRGTGDHELVVERTEDCYNESGATTEAIWCDEPVYVHAPWYNTGDEYQQVREQNYCIFIEGGSGINFGNEIYWGAGGPQLFPVAGERDPDWLDQLADDSSIQAGICWTFVDTHCTEASFLPTSAFVTTGEGTGDTKAAQGASGNVAVAYFPDNRTIQVDTTIISGTGNVKLRWFDPVLGTYSTIAASEAQTTGRSVTMPAARGDGTRDFLLVVESVADVSTTGRLDVGATAYAGLVNHNASVTGVVHAGVMPVSATTHSLSTTGALWVAAVAVSSTTHQSPVIGVVPAGISPQALVSHNASPTAIVFLGATVRSDVSHLLSSSGYLAVGVSLAVAAEGGGFNICFEVGAPVIVDRTVVLTMVARILGDPTLVDRSLGAPDIPLREVALAMVERVVGDPAIQDRDVSLTFEDRTATLAFEDRDVGDPQIGCEE